MGGTMRIFNRCLATAALCIFALCAGPPSALATRTQVLLHLEGMHPADTESHQGTFTASPPLCPSGSWLGNGEGRRVFTCYDQSGSFTAGFAGELEHTQGATGLWVIVGGTGAYTVLRGEGTGKVDFSTGEKASPIRFSDTWTGFVDFDATAPTGSFTAVKLARPHTPRGRWHVNVSFSARDDVNGNPVRFNATAAVGRFSTERSGTTTSGVASVAFAFRPVRGARLLRIAIELSDPWGNARTIQRNVRLRSR
jgi:hypothetical protein